MRGGHMPKKAAKKPSKKTSARRAPKPVKPAAQVKAAKSPAKKPATKTKAAKPAPPTTAAVGAPFDGKLTFNHAMIYCKDVERVVRFYRDLMGFKLIEDFRYEGTAVYDIGRASCRER